MPTDEEPQCQMDAATKETVQLIALDEQQTALAGKQRKVLDKQRAVLLEQKKVLDEQHAVLNKQGAALDEQQMTLAEKAAVLGEQDTKQKDEQKADQYATLTGQYATLADQYATLADQNTALTGQYATLADQFVAFGKALEKVLNRFYAKSCFVHHICCIEEYLFSQLKHVQDPKEASSGVVGPCVDGSVYPLRLRLWTDFAASHLTTFNDLVTVFADEKLFLSEDILTDYGHGLSGRYENEEHWLRFICSAIEEPTSAIVSKYLELSGHPTYDAFRFSYHAYSIQCVSNVKKKKKEEAAVDVDTAEPPAEAKAKSRPELPEGIPERWGRFTDHDDSRYPILVGEYRTARKLSAEMLHRVMSAPPEEDFFQRAINKQAEASDDVSVAHALYQTYHYMIHSGLEFGYVALCDGLVFLRVLADDPRTLYYFSVVFPPPAPATSGPSEGENEGAGAIVTTARAPQDTAVAYLTTLCILALKSTLRTPDWIDQTSRTLAPWPTPYDEYVATPTLPTTVASLHPNVPGPAQTQFVLEPPTLPYCTQACLLGLCRGLPLDEACPNTELHRAAAHAEAGEPNSHPLTAEQVQALVVAQLARSMDKDCACLDQQGLFGHWGALFRITVTGYGYTLVAKGVQAVHRSMLAHEATVYRFLDQFQGRLVPVFLGVIDLERPFPLHSYAKVAHMMLLAYVGPSLSSMKKSERPKGVDLWEEKHKTADELHAAGLRNDDVYDRNMAWSTEAARVMHFDFGRVRMKKRRASDDGDGQGDSDSDRDDDGDDDGDGDGDNNGGGDNNGSDKKDGNCDDAGNDKAAQ